MTTTKARPTELMGITFKSKSEAQVALLLHSLGYYWIYEPWFLELEDGYCPDFLVFEYLPVGDNPFKSPRNAHINLHIVEYKPGVPTNAYMDELRGRLEQCMYLMTQWMPWCCRTPEDTSAHLLVGGVGYEKAQMASIRPSYEDRHGVKCDSAWEPWVRGWGFARHMCKIDVDATTEYNKGYRFDLKNPEHKYMFVPNEITEDTF